jgi:hypothetical protein
MAKALFLETVEGFSRTVLYDTAGAKSDVLATRTINAVVYTLYRGKTGVASATPRYFLYSDPASGGVGFQLVNLAEAVDFYGKPDAMQSLTPANAFTPIPVVEA